MERRPASRAFDAIPSARPGQPVLQAIPPGPFRRQPRPRAVLCTSIRPVQMAGRCRADLMERLSPNGASLRAFPVAEELPLPHLSLWISPEGLISAREAVPLRPLKLAPFALARKSHEFERGEMTKYPNTQGKPEYRSPKWRGRTGTPCPDRVRASEFVIPSFLGIWVFGYFLIYRNIYIHVIIKTRGGSRGFWLANSGSVT
jgi:hypothetical protein